MITREDLERREDMTLAGYAMRSGDSLGRHYEERSIPIGRRISATATA